MAMSDQHPQRSIHLRPTSRLTWLGLALLLLSVVGFMFSVITWDALSWLLGHENVGPDRDLLGYVLIWLPGIASPVVLLAAMALRHERSIAGIGATVLAVLWVWVVYAFTTG